ncbi:hypothetical protein [Oceaniferula spumae]|uniref:hypothetical protein n=1 Tax=Oceaniferula spumae TaxID=2979115 RepID=UPI003F4E4795
MARFFRLTDQARWLPVCTLTAGLLMALPLSVSAADEDGVAEDQKEAAAEPARDITTLVADLGHESYNTREKAMASLWKLGNAALPSLRSAAEGPDPEVSSRATELVLYISAGVLPDSPEEVKQLVIQFARSEVDSKLTILRKLMELGQWHQVLHLARLEKDPAARSRMADVVQASASQAAREAIIKGDFDKAGEILELTGDDEQNMAMRAWFYVRQGELKQRLAKAADMPGKKGAIWRMSLHRAGGDVKAAVKEAEKAGLTNLADAMRVFTGDALPWLNSSNDGGRVSAILGLGYQIQKARLLGEDKKASIIARELVRMANDEDSSAHAAICLAANGFSKEAVRLLSANEMDSAFDYFDNIEMPERCLELLGIEKDAKPPYTKWVNKVTEEATESEDEALYDWLLLLAGFLDRHGEGEHSMAVMKPMMTALEKDGADAWFDILTRMRAYDLGWLAIKFVEARGNEDGEMNLAVSKLFGENSSVTEIWNALKQRHPDDINKALHEIALLAGIIADTQNETEKIHQSLLAEIVGPNAKPEVMEKARSEALYAFAINRNNLTEASRLADIFAAKDERWKRSKTFLDAALQRWEKVAPVYADLAKEHPGEYLNLIKWSIALRKLGKEDEAAKAYDRSLMLTMGDSAALGKIGAELSGAGYDAEAVALWELSAIMSTGQDSEYSQAILYLSTYGQHLYESKQWKKAAAIAEVYTRILMRGRSGSYLHRILRGRFYADFSHAMHLFENGKRAVAIEKLDQCRQLIPGDGSLADDFFPALRNAGIGEVYNRWFEESYRHVNAACELYPDSHNSRNTAAWLASRAVRRLDDAHQHAEAALKIRPSQGAYLDTMAEVWFARGNREKAVEWSKKAVDASISDAQGTPRSEQQTIINYNQLSKQLDRFKNAPMPR